MDHADHDRSGIAFGTLPSRVRELSRQFTLRLGLALPKKSYLGKLKIAAFIGLAVLFGTIAFRLNREETELQWRRSHVPSPAVWAESFANAGFRPISNPSRVAKITRRLPSVADLTGRIWRASPDWWAIEASDGTQPLLFCASCAGKAPPTDWTPVGSGWDGWEEAVKQAKAEAQSFRVADHPGKRRALALDPREIRY